MPDSTESTAITDGLDGNAAAGTLTELFVAEMTTAITTCAACGDSRRIGELLAYLQAPGLILRCASCQAVQLRLVRAETRAWLDLRGVRVLEVELPEDQNANRPGRLP
jgi:hypothetical protein